MSTIAKAFMERLGAGIQRKSISTPSRWALQYRIMGSPFPGPFSFKYHPWLREMHDSQAPENSGQKSAQMGYTENLLDIAFFTNDIKQRDVLYVLPNKTPDASDFSASRFDAAVELSAHLKALYSDVKNIGHKRAGAANMYIRGSQAKAGLKSVPVSVLLLDEVEEMNQDNIPLAYERLSGQMEKLIWAISTASIAGVGINKIFSRSSQEHFFFKCPCCSRQVEFRWPDSLVITGDELDDPKLVNSHLICTECKNKLHHEAKYEYLQSGLWVPSFPDRVQLHRGFYVNQMYSSTVSPFELAVAFIKGRSDQTSEQEFFNSKMGLPHEAKGARLSDGEIRACIGDHLSGPRYTAGKIVTMGVDQGRVCHYEIDEWTIGQFHGNDANTRAHCKVLEVGTTKSFDDLDKLMSKFGIHACVIDAHPERRTAFAFASRFFGYVWMAFYGNGVNGKQIHLNETEEGEPMITVDRTSWMDAALNRFRGERKRISICKDAGPEYTEHLKAPVRVNKMDQNGNPVARYMNDKADHYAHARTYSEIAFKQAVQAASHQDIT